MGSFYLWSINSIFQEIVIAVCDLCKKHILISFSSYKLVVKSVGSVRLFMFLKEVSSAHQGCIYLIKKYIKKHKYCEILLQCKITSFFSVMRSCIFSIITPVFSVTWSSEIILICWFADQEIFLIIINVENSCTASYFYGNCNIIL